MTLPPPSPWLRNIPSKLLYWRDAEGCSRLEAHLAENGMPRPSWLDVIAERKRRSAPRGA